MVLLSLSPQIHLWMVRGRDWNGAYVIPQGDEPLYSAYINALIDGRTRRNDPFGAKDSSASIVGRYGLFERFLDIGVPALPFLRRYQPAAAFPLLFVFQIQVWHALTNQSKRGTRAIIAGLTLATLVFSYLYLWTAAATWLACIGALWFYLRPSERWKTLAILTTIGAITAIALVPYAYLVSHRAATLDEQLTLTSTHSPDLLRVHEILGAAILVALIIGILRRRIERAEPRVIYAISLALLPFIVFNQQILTGKTMQVFHFEIFVVNYFTLVALLITLTLFWKPVPRRLLIWMAGLSFAWGVIVVGLPSRLVFVPLAIANDKSVPVLRRLKELSMQDGTFVDLRAKGQASNLVFSPSVALIRLLPTWTSQGTLLDVGGVDFGSVTREERKNFFYMHLYYSRVESEALRQVLNGALDGSHDELSFAPSVIFGLERVYPALSSQFKPIQQDEIEREVQAYLTYANSFSREEALKRPIAYAVVPVDGSFDFSNLDRWYERDAGERVGAYDLYRLKLRK